MIDLTGRQKDLLKAIIEIFVKEGIPVGSENIEKGYNLGVSPATIRNEMARLTEMGLLKQPHTSAGRIPTSMGFRIYISEIMKEKDMPISAEVTIKEALWQQRYQMNRMLKEAVRALAFRCQMLAVAISDEGDMYSAGVAHILDFVEFEDIDVARFVLSLFDEYPTLSGIIRQAEGPSPLHILFGEELGYEHLMPTSFVFYKFISPKGEGVIGVIGPARMNFPVVIPYVRYTAGLIEQALRG